MQQTDKYKLNLIETSDVFSPAALNENMEKVEAQFDAVRVEAAAGDTAEAQARTQGIAAEAQARAAGDTAEAQTRAEADAALDTRVQVLEAHKLIAGRYIGDGTNDRIIEFGFTPTAVYLSGYGVGPTILLPDTPVVNNTLAAGIVPGGLKVGVAMNGASGNTNTAIYCYIALC